MEAEECASERGTGRAYELRDASPLQAIIDGRVGYSTAGAFIFMQIMRSLKK